MACSDSVVVLAENEGAKKRVWRIGSDELRITAGIPVQRDREAPWQDKRARARSLIRRLGGQFLEHRFQTALCALQRKHLQALVHGELEHGRPNVVLLAEVEDPCVPIA